MAKLQANNTTVVTQNNTTTVTLHTMPIVVFDNEKIVLRNDGWNTQVTKRRMNEVATIFDLPYEISQLHGKWWVTKKTRGECVQFFDGITIPRQPR